MQLVRPAFASHPRHFGRGGVRAESEAGGQAPSLPGDLKLFVGTFLAGFVFVSILIG